MKKSTIVGYSIGPVAVAIIGAITLPVLTWIFPINVVGRLSMLQVAVQFSTLLFSLGMDQSYVREYHQESDKNSLLISAATPGFLILILFNIATAVAVPGLMAKMLYGEGGASLWLITLLCFDFSYIIRFFSLELRMLERSFLFSISRLLSRLSFLILVVLFALFVTQKNFQIVLIAQAVSLTIGGAVTLSFVKFGKSRLKNIWIDANKVRSLFDYGWPLIFGGLAAWGLAAVDRIFIRTFSGYHELAVYAAAASIGGIVSLVTSVFNLIWAPLVFKWLSKNEDVKKTDEIAEAAAYILFAIVLASGASSWIVSYLLPPEYEDVKYMIIGTMLSPLLYTLSEVTGIGIAISRKTILSLMCSAFALVVDLLICFYLVPRLGASGAMIATVVAFWAFFTLRTEVSARIWRRVSDWRIHAYVAVGVMISISYIFLGRMFNLLFPLLCFALLMVFVWWKRSYFRKLWLMTSP